MLFLLCLKSVTLITRVYLVYRFLTVILLVLLSLYIIYLIVYCNTISSFTAGYGKAFNTGIFASVYSRVCSEIDILIHKTHSSPLYDSLYGEISAPLDHHYLTVTRNAIIWTSIEHMRHDPTRELGRDR